MVLIFFSDERVESRLGLEKRGIQRSLGPIVRVQMKIDIALRRERVLRMERVTRRKSETSQRHWNQRRRSSLAASDEKVATPAIRRIRIDWEGTSRERLERVPRLPRTPQNVPRILKSGTEI